MTNGKATGVQSVCVAQIGGRRDYMVPRALHTLNRLEHLYTDIGFSESSPLSAISSRVIRDIPTEKISSFPALAISRKWKSRSAGHSEDPASNWLSANMEFGNRVCKAGFKHADALYAFNGAAIECFKKAKDDGHTCWLDQTSAAMRWDQDLLSAEHEKWPDWQAPTVHSNSWNKMADREEQEWEKADLILCGSDYVSHSIARQGGPSDKCRVVPYGRVENKRPTRTLPSKEQTQRPLNILFAGTLELRKGVPYLAQVAKQMDPVRFNIQAVGPSHLTAKGLQAFTKNIHYSGKVSMDELNKQYAKSDILLLPSISEGSANVIHEALSWGCLVICTDQSGAPFLDKQGGYIVPAGKTEDICSLLESLDKNRDSLYQQAQQGQQFAQTHLSFEAYCKRMELLLAGSDSYG